IRIDPKLPGGYLNRGIAWSGRGDKDRALADSNKAIEIDPREPLAFVHRGFIYLSKQDYRAALIDFSKAIELDPTNSLAYFARARTNLFVGATTEALADLERAAELDPKFPYVALWLDIASKRNNMPGRLAQTMARFDMQKWPAPIIQLYLGELTPEAAL